MKHITINGKAVGSQPVRQVISRSAILILSGVLIGTTVTQGQMTSAAFCRFCTGIIGMIAFYALDRAAQGRQDRVVRKELAAADTTLTTRLQRHVVPETEDPPERRHPPAAADSSYPPVTVGPRN